MKVSSAAVAAATAPKGEKPLLPLVQDCTKLNKTNSITYKLHTDVADNSSPTYEHTVQVLEGTEDLQDVL